MRDHILLYINGLPHRVTGSDVLMTLADFIRRKLGLMGTKIVCSEGDCGSCSVLCGRLVGEAIDYRPIDSCIRFMFQLDATHVVSIEGLGGAHASDDRPLTEVQQQMVDCHGSQCGFCTPGFVMTMTGLLENQMGLTEADLRYGLTGNLCRCTGYSPIIEAGKRCETGLKAGPRLNETYPAEPIVKELATATKDVIAISMRSGDKTHHVFCPTTIQAAVELLTEYPAARLAAGATDVGVQINKGLAHPTAWIDLNRISELEGVEVTDSKIVAGARATWTEIEAVVALILPEFHQIVSVFGSPQIRHVGTLGGNLINASPIADSIPFLCVSDAQLEIVGVSGTRMVNINDFYHGYKEYDLHPGELLAAIHLPIPPSNRQLRLYKISRRRDLDISSFTAAIWVEVEGDTIQDAGLAYGAVGPTVLRLRQTEAFLRGKSFTDDTMRQAGDIVVEEISPISDVRGSAQYRLQLARNVLMKFYFQVTESQPAA